MSNLNQIQILRRFVVGFSGDQYYDLQIPESDLQDEHLKPPKSNKSMSQDICNEAPDSDLYCGYYRELLAEKYSLPIDQINFVVDQDWIEDHRQEIMELGLEEIQQPGSSSDTKNSDKIMIPDTDSLSLFWYWDKINLNELHKAAATAQQSGQHFTVPVSQTSPYRVFIQSVQFQSDVSQEGQAQSTVDYHIGDLTSQKEFKSALLNLYETSKSKFEAWIFQKEYLNCYYLSITESQVESCIENADSSEAQQSEEQNLPKTVLASQETQESPESETKSQQEPPSEQEQQSTTVQKVTQPQQKKKIFLPPTQSFLHSISKSLLQILYTGDQSYMVCHSRKWRLQTGDCLRILRKHGLECNTDSATVLTLDFGKRLESLVYAPYNASGSDTVDSRVGQGSLHFPKRIRKEIKSNYDGHEEFILYTSDEQNDSWDNVPYLDCGAELGRYYFEKGSWSYNEEERNFDGRIVINLEQLENGSKKSESDSESDQTTSYDHDEFHGITNSILGLVQFAKSVGSKMMKGNDTGQTDSESTSDTVGTVTVADKLKAIVNTTLKNSDSPTNSKKTTKPKPTFILDFNLLFSTDLSFIVNWSTVTLSVKDSMVLRKLTFRPKSSGYGNIDDPQLYYSLMMSQVLKEKLREKGLLREPDVVNESSK